MRLVSAIFIVFALTACGDDPAPLFADAVWQVQCRCYGMCSAIPTHDVKHLDGEDGNVISCSIYQRSGKNVLTANVRKGNEYQLEIRDAEFMASGGPVSGAGCTVTVVENGNTFSGRCGAAAPSVEQPCRISGLTLNTDEMGNPQVEGDLLCFHLPSVTGALTPREVGLPNIQSMGDAEMCVPTEGAQPVHFRFVNCTGL